MKLVKSLFIIVALLSISLPCFARKIDMNGKWMRMQKSTSMDIPIEASIDESSKQLSLQFQEDLGLVYVTVTNCSGEVVYHEEVETTEQIFLEIQLDSLLNESYLLMVNNDKNNVQGIINL